MGAIKYSEMRKNRQLGDFFITDQFEEDDMEYTDYIG